MVTVQKQLICISALGLKVYRVNGKEIRDNITLEFTNLANHYYFEWIPLGELWLDYTIDTNEISKFIELGNLEYDLMHIGHTYINAHEMAINHIHTKRTLPINSVVKNFMRFNEPYPVTVNLVNGYIVRQHDFDFTLGTHSLVHNYLPPKTIWLEISLKADEYKPVLIHELSEYYAMEYGKQPYDNAHDAANVKEAYARHHPEEADNILADIYNNLK